MPRPRRIRRIFFEPNAKCFKPVGVPLSETGSISVSHDEIEALRMSDFECINQVDAAKKMGISQPTFNRLVSCARKKVADALVNSKSIIIEGGDFIMEKGFGRGSGMGRGAGFGAPALTCRCTVCGHVEAKQRGMPCMRMKCPKCGNAMIRGE